MGVVVCFIDSVCVSFSVPSPTDIVTAEVEYLCEAVHGSCYVVFCAFECVMVGSRLEYCRFVSWFCSILIVVSVGHSTSVCCLWVVCQVSLVLLGLVVVLFLQIN